MDNSDMKPLEEIYGPKFFARRDKLIWRAPIICEAINDVFQPTSVVDVGCGIADYVEYFNKNLNIDAWGIEGSEVCRPYLVSDKVTILDMRQEHHVWVRSNGRADLAMALEVLEHIEAEYSDIFVENLTKLSDRILVSAAPPGAGGHHHVNCREQSYWHEKFLKFNYSYDEENTFAIREALKPWRHRKELYHNNLIVYKGE